MWRIGAFFGWLWDGVRDEWESASRLAHAEAISVGVMVGYSAIYIPLYFHTRIVEHPPYPHPDTLSKSGSDLLYAWQLSPAQFLAGLGWNVVVLVATALFLTYCVVRVRSGMRTLARRRQERQRDGGGHRDPPEPLAKDGVDLGEVGGDGQVWDQIIESARRGGSEQL